MRKTRPMLQPQRLRAATAPTSRGSSSLLRLSVGASRLPSGAEIGQWIDRAARACQGDALSTTY